MNYKRNIFLSVLTVSLEFFFFNLELVASTDAIIYSLKGN